MQDFYYRTNYSQGDTSFCITEPIIPEEIEALQAQNRRHRFEKKESKQADQTAPSNQKTKEIKDWAGAG